MKIIVIEDNEQVSTLLKSAAQRWGHQVTIADTGQKAIAIVKKQIFDLIMLDIFLPDIMGYDLIPLLKNEWSGMEIITMTGRSSMDIEERTRRQGILYYMVKPIDLSELRSILDHMNKKINHL
ncbi:MAG: response regulator [Desulfobacterales bacterium]|nr:response regulator [Desulfobacterales bacterium]